MDSETIVLIAGLVLVLVALYAALDWERLTRRSSSSRREPGYVRIAAESPWDNELARRRQARARAEARHAARQGGE